MSEDVSMKHLLLSKINGSLVAPPNFRQHYKNISTSIGVVKSSTIAEMFPDYEIILDFLSILNIARTL